MKKDVIFLDKYNDLYNLNQYSSLKFLEINSLKEKDIQSLRSTVHRDITKHFGGGESRMHVVDAIEGFANAEFKLYDWRGLYIKSDGKLSVIEDYRLDMK